MRIHRTLLLFSTLAALGACNMVISEAPMFGESDRAKLIPRDGVWLADVEDCRFDAGQPEASWPKCAVWVIARDRGRELLLTDGKGQSQRIVAIYASGSPAIVQGQWTDDAKKPPSTLYGFYGLEPAKVGPNGRFAAASIWPVECGIKSGAGIDPFPGISPECRPSSKKAIRAAAKSSRPTAEISRLRWLRAEKR